MKNRFNELIDYMTSEPVVVQILEEIMLFKSIEELWDPLIQQMQKIIQLEKSMD